MNRNVSLPAVLALLTLLAGCSQRFDPAPYLALNEQYDVTIERDIWGVPHIHGRRDVDTAFGFAYAQAEDNWAMLQEFMPLYRGENARFEGADAAPVDFMVQWLDIGATIDRDYETQLAPETRAYVEAFVDGLNYYAALHPEVADGRILPVTAKDIIASFMLRHLLFYGFDKTLQELTGPERAREISIARSVSLNGLPVGSNTFAVAPHNSEDGATRLAINSHQPLTGPVAWYEAHISSDEGLDVMGGLFPGSPTISVGFTHDTAWAATVNKPDLVDVYVLEINPDNPNQYRLDGKWRELEVRDLPITVKLAGPLHWTFHEEGLRSEHGPVLRTEHGTYAVRYAGMDELRQVEQWMAMSKARNLEQWLDAMRLHRFASFNFGYADRDGNIALVHNAMTPQRRPGHDWQQYLPGDDSGLIWDTYLPFDQQPMVINPPSGWVISANQTPFRVTAAQDDPNPADFPAEAGFQTRMTNRADRGLALFEALSPISADEFDMIKHDKQYAFDSRAGRYLQAALDLDLSEAEPRYQQAQAVLADWDRNTDVDNTGAALGTCVITAEWQAEQSGVAVPPVRAELERCTDTLLAAVGRVDPPWGDINRHVRGDLSLPVGGGPDTLRAAYGRGIEVDGFHTNVAGDGLYYLVSWDRDGEQTIQGIHPFGSATLDTASPHYADQAPDYAAERLHDPLFDAGTRRDKVLSTYRPGEEKRAAQ